MTMTTDNTASAHNLLLCLDCATVTTAKNSVTFTDGQKSDANTPGGHVAVPQRCDNQYT